jgi:Domain of unknown function (DUF4388)
MSISGSLETFSLPELFRLLDSGSKSGKLTLSTLLGSSSLIKGNIDYHIWFYKGKLIALTKPNEHKQTISIIESRGWLSDRVLEKLVPLCPEGHPLGTYFKSIGALEEQHLNLLFQISLAEILELFELTSGKFQFEAISGEDRTATLKYMPWLEMTGVSLRAAEVVLLALRKTRNWERFSSQLPELSSGLQKLSTDPPVRFDSLESHLWKNANSITPLEDIAKQIEHSEIEIQKAAFRLIVTGLVEEVSQATLRAGMVSVRPLPPAAVSPSTIELPQKKQVSERISEKLKVSASLLHNFMDFLKNKL